MTLQKKRTIPQRIMRALRYVCIFCFAGWAGAAAAFEMWGEMVFFIAYLLLVYFLGIGYDRYLDRQ